MRHFPFFSVSLRLEMNTNFNFKEEQTWRNLVMRAVLIIASIGLIVWAMPHDNRSYYHIEKGKPWKYADFTAPFDFPVYKSDEAIKAEKDSLMKGFEPYYQYHQDKEAQMVKKFQKDYAEGIPDWEKSSFRLSPIASTAYTNRASCRPSSILNCVLIRQE